MTVTPVLTATSDVDAAHDPLRWFAESSVTYLGAPGILEPWQLPAPYCDLLVHEGSMTERIERHFGGRIVLAILSAFVSAHWYARWSLLLDAAGRCLEMGGVCLDLRAVPASLRVDILEGEQPLGRLLSGHRLTCQSVPQSFFSVTAIAPIKDLLQMRETCRVFGRRTDLRANGQKLADVIEVLPCYDVQTSRAAEISCAAEITRATEITRRATW